MAPDLALTPVKLLEIGVRQGWSHLTWKEYFKSGEIYGIENFASPVFEKQNKDCNLKDIEVFIGDQADKDFFSDLPVFELDIIIDDGGHRMSTRSSCTKVSQQQISLAKLIKRLKPGGLYIIEDMHTSKPSMKNLYWDDDDLTKTTFHVLKNLQNSVYINNNDWKYLLQRIKNIEFLVDNKLCVIYT